MNAFDRKRFFGRHGSTLQNLGVDADRLVQMKECAFLALNWLVINQSYLALTREADVLLVVYEHLCARADETVKQIFEFLHWEIMPQTSQYVCASQKPQGPVLAALRQLKHPYYAVYQRRNPERRTGEEDLPASDVRAVLDAVETFPLHDYWPEILRPVP